MSSVKKCDFCGNIVDEFKGRNINEVTIKPYVAFNHFNVNSSEKFELCEECLNKFLNLKERKD